MILSAHARGVVGNARELARRVPHPPPVRLHEGYRACRSITPSSRVTSGVTHEHTVESSLRAADAADDQLGHPGTAEAHRAARHHLVRRRPAGPRPLPGRGDEGGDRGRARDQGPDRPAVQHDRGLPAAARDDRAPHGALRHRGGHRQHPDHERVAAGARPHRQGPDQPRRQAAGREPDVPGRHPGVHDVRRRVRHRPDRRRRDGDRQAARMRCAAARSSSTRSRTSRTRRA